MIRQIVIGKEIFGNGENLLLRGDVMKLPPELAAYKGRVQCVYLDPPFMTGKSFPRKRPLGEKGWAKGTPSLKLPGFEDNFHGEKNYLKLLRKMVTVAKDLLAPTGVFYLHLDWRATAQARQICDKVFGKTRFLNEIIWSYESGGRTKRFFPRKHDSILLYARSESYRFDLTKVPLPREGNRRNHMARGRDEQGRMYSAIVSHGKEYRYYDDDPVYPSDVWNDIGILQQKDPERTGYATQKPVKLLERLLLPVTEPGDIVADLCCGSGTTLAAAENLGCRYLGMDISPAAVAVAAHRLKDDNLTVICPCREGDGELLAEYDETARRLRVKGLKVKGCRELAGADPGDIPESWEPGRIENGAFRAEKSYRRSFRYPALTDSLQAEPGSLPEAILMTDAAGSRRVFLLEWEQQVQ